MILFALPIKEKLIEQIKSSDKLKKLSFFLYSNKDDMPSFYYLKGIKRALDEFSIPYVEEFLDLSKSRDENIKIFKNKSKGKMIILARPLKDKYEDDLIPLIDSFFDPDMMSITNIGKLYAGDLNYLPATAKSVKSFIDYYKLDLTNKRCLVIGRSNTVGLPVSMLVQKYNGLVKLVHSKISIENINAEVKNSDYIFLCSGKSNLIDRKLFNSNQVVIDCGFSSNGGDLGFIPEENELKAYTPVPKGIGVLTSYQLIINALNLL